ncbi:hypothetical protein BGZ46_003278 [Entomortierella lignicola]|nr:hypothetical protein BGZ46_003278 [Entomortierella lignicola]
MTNSTLAVKPTSSHLTHSPSMKSSNTIRIEKDKDPFQQQPISSSIAVSPIWDYNRFPVDPCFREKNTTRISQEQPNPFIIDYSLPQGNNSSAGNVVRTPSSSPSLVEPNHRNHRYNRRHGSSSSSSSINGSRSRNISSHDLNISISTPSNENNNTASLHSSPHDIAGPFFTSAESHHASSNPQPPVLSKFDHYKAQMERVRSTRVHSSSPSTSSRLTTAQQQQQLDTSISPSPSLSKKTSSRLIPKLFKKASKSKSAPSNVTQSNPSMAPLRPSLDNEKRHDATAPLQSSPHSDSSSSRFGNEKNGAVDLDGVEQQKSSLEEQRDYWRDEWLRPSGAIHSMFADRPSKFDCPHCGAIKVVSHVQFIPGVMSYLVAFGLLFLTFGTLSFLPFRKDHEGTKDCIHWCPECSQKVARFNRANATWDWI